MKAKQTDHVGENLRAATGAQLPIKESQRYQERMQEIDCKVVAQVGILVGGSGDALSFRSWRVIRF